MYCRSRCTQRVHRQRQEQEQPHRVERPHVSGPKTPSSRLLHNCDRRPPPSGRPAAYRDALSFAGEMLNPFCALTAFIPGTTTVRAKQTLRAILHGYHPEWDKVNSAEEKPEGEWSSRPHSLRLGAALSTFPCASEQDPAGLHQRR